MGRCDQLRRQHQQLAEAVARLAPQLHPCVVAAEASSIRTALASFAGALNVHLAMEDESLYPMMLASTDPTTRSTAAMFRRDLGGLATMFLEYMEQWPGADSLVARPVEFCAQTEAVFDALAKRVQQEESALYPLADAM